MIIFLQPGEQVEVQFVESGSKQQPSSMKTFKNVVVVKHECAGQAKVGTIDGKGWFVEAFDADMQISS